MELYYRTPEAESILKEGFKDSDGYFMNNVLYSGVWFSSTQPEIRASAQSEALLKIEIPEDVVAEYELHKGVKPEREFLVPAIVANEYGKPVVIAEGL